MDCACALVARVTCPQYYMPVTGYMSFNDTAHAIALRPYEYKTGYHQTNKKIDIGKTLKRWSVLVDHYIYRKRKCTTSSTS